MILSTANDGSISCLIACSMTFPRLTSSSSVTSDVERSDVRCYIQRQSIRHPLACGQRLIEGHLKRRIPQSILVNTGLSRIAGSKHASKDLGSCFNAGLERTSFGWSLD